MALKDYKKKRDFSKTSEPVGSKTKSKKKGLAFVVQKHAASRLHYDFRLEVGGVLKSWAVPKGPSLNPSDKRLAIQVEDHPYDYLLFEGLIPKGSYGAGTVMVWDTGVYYPLTSKLEAGNSKTIKEGLEKGEITFRLEGEKLLGIFSLIKMKGSENQWLLIKRKDEHASAEDLSKQDYSVLSGHTMEQIEQEKPAQKVKQQNIQPHRKSLLKKSAMPHQIKPMLAYLADKPFDGDEWLFEMKWDGFRAIAEIDGSKVSLYSRNFKSLNQRFAPVVEELKKLGTAAIFDGEIVVVNDKGISSFQALQNYQKTNKGNLRYYVFDLLYHAGQDLRSLPLRERKNHLQVLLNALPSSIISYNDHILAKGIQFFAAAEKQHLEGIMAKQIDSSYESVRSHAWLKIKTHARQEALIAGFTEPRGSRKHFGALILGVYEKGKLRYIGHVGGGFDQSSLNALMKKMQPLITKKCPFKTPPETNAPVIWIRPELICEVSFAEWTHDNIMRQPIYVGLRSDKEPASVVKEEAVSLKSAEKKTLSTSKSSNEHSKKINAKGSTKVQLTHLDKIFWPAEGYTKGDLIEYYREISPLILPYLKNRPQILHRFPNGIEADGFYQKNVDHQIPEWLPTVDIDHDNKKVRYLLIPDLSALLFAVNLGCVDLNPFNSRVQHLHEPDYMVIDLDPESISFAKVVETAQVLHDIFDSIGAPNYCKTSGGRGLHLYIPLGAKYSYDQVKQFAHLISQIAHERLPKITSMERSPAKRQKKSLF